MLLLVDCVFVFWLGSLQIYPRRHYIRVFRQMALGMNLDLGSRSFGNLHIGSKGFPMEPLVWALSFSTGDRKYGTPCARCPISVLQWVYDNSNLRARASQRLLAFEGLHACAYSQGSSSKCRGYSSAQSFQKTLTKEHTVNLTRTHPCMIHGLFF